MTKTTVQLINCGFFYADGGSMFGATPQSAWKRRYPMDKDNRCILSMHVGLITTKSGRIMLIDNGIGNKQLEKLCASHYHFYGVTDLCEALHKRGIAPNDVTDIVLTHLHFDHCGYSSQYNNKGELTLTFPNATCWISETQWNEYHNPNPLEKSSFFSEDLKIYENLTNLHLIKNEEFIDNDIRLRLFNGHTHGQIVLDAQTDEFTVVFAGDVIPTSAHLSPSWISAIDIFPLDSYYEKIRLLDEAAANNQAIVFYHDAYTPCSTVKKINNFYKIGHKIMI